MQQLLSLPRSLVTPRAIQLLALALAVQLALAAALALRQDRLAQSTPQTPLIGAGAQSADRIVIDANAADHATSGAKSVVLAERNGQWSLPQYSDAPVTGAKVSALLAQLAGLKRGLPVGISSAALKRFKIANDDFERRVVLSRDGKALGTLYIGDSSGVHKSYARTLADRAAYSVDLASYELPIEQSDWLDTELPARDLASLSEIDVATDPSHRVQLQHQTASAAAAPPSASGATQATTASTAANALVGWKASGLPAGSALEQTHADALAGDIAALRVQGVLGVQARPEWQADHPALVLVMKAAGVNTPSVSWTLAKPTSGDYYVLKSSQYPWYFQLDSSSAKQLIDASASGALVAGAAAPKAATQSAPAQAPAASQRPAGRAHPKRS